MELNGVYLLLAAHPGEGFRFPAGEFEHSRGAWAVLCRLNGIAPDGTETDPALDVHAFSSPWLLDFHARMEPELLRALLACTSHRDAKTYWCVGECELSHNGCGQDGVGSRFRQWSYESSSFYASVSERLNSLTILEPLDVEPFLCFSLGSDRQQYECSRVAGELEPLLTGASPNRVPLAPLGSTLSTELSLVDFCGSYAIALFSPEEEGRNLLQARSVLSHAKASYVLELGMGESNSWQDEPWSWAVVADRAERV